MSKKIIKIIIALWIVLLLVLFVLPLMLLTSPITVNPIVNNFFWTNPVWGRILYGYTIFIATTQPFDHDTVPILITNSFLVGLAVAYFLIPRDRINVLLKIGSLIRLFFIAVLEVIVSYCGWYLANHFSYYCDKGIANASVVFLFIWAVLASIF
jgi:hypothetical protein